MDESKEPTSKPTAIDVDVDQWRRDVQTFGDATRQAIERIVAELSSQCSTVQSPTSTRAISSSTKPASNPSLAEKNTTGAPGGDRLSDLKAKLAERLNRKK